MIRGSYPLLPGKTCVGTQKLKLFKILNAFTTNLNFEKSQLVILEADLMRRW